MYEIVDRYRKKAVRTMCIKVPDAPTIDGFIRLDRYNYEQVYGKQKKNIFYHHLDGNYKNCDISNLVCVSSGHKGRLTELLAGLEDKDARELIITSILLMDKVNEIKGQQFSYLWVRNHTVLQADREKRKKILCRRIF